MSLRVIALAALAVLALAGPARAHQSSVKYIDLTVAGGRVSVRFTVAPADVTAPLGLPDDAMPSVATAAVPAAAAYVARWLALSIPDGAACAPGAASAAPDPDGKFVVVLWEAACPADIERLRIDLTAFFAVDARHEALVSIHRPDAHATPHVVRAGAPVVELHSGQTPGLGTWIAWGMHHIFFGPDHICFVLALLIVVVIARGAGGEWQRRRARDALRSTAAIVTAFTVAHSLTLIAASLGWIHLPSRLVESAIAASIVYTAIEDVARPAVRWRFALAFGFGLVHGLGFASMLEERLPPTDIIAPLLGFNLGVELGQLAIVGCALPLLWLLARVVGPRAYRRVAVPALAAPLVVLGILWLLERFFELELISALGM